jgi:hypothetical protein
LSKQNTPMRLREKIIAAACILFGLIVMGCYVCAQFGMLFQQSQPASETDLTSYQGETELEKHAEAERIVQSELARINKLTEQENKKEDKKINDLVAMGKSQGIIKNVDCGSDEGRAESFVDINPVGWYGMDLEQKQKFASLIIKYCSTRGTSSNILSIFNMMDGKSLGYADEDGLIVK